MDCSIESTPHKKACVYSSAYDGGELMKQFGEPVQSDEITTRADGVFATTSNPWPRREEEESRAVASMQKRRPGTTRSNRWDQYGESSSATPSEAHGMSDSSVVTESTWGSMGVCYQSPAGTSALQASEGQ